MALVNIGQDNKDDGFYRYKMPRLLTKIEGRGNGIKTNIVNMVDVAKALARPPSYTTKYFGCVLGAQSKFDEKTGTSTVNGAHDTAKLVQLLEGFIKKYVQCYGCGNPETEIIITKGMITLKCAACGFVSDVDMRDKLTTFILNNPPEQKKKKGDKNMRRAEKERLKAGEVLDEETKKSKKDTKKKATSDDKKKKKKGAAADEDMVEKQESSPEASQKDEQEADEDDVEWQTDTSAEAAKARIQEQLSAATASMVMVSTADDEKTNEAVGNGHTPASPSSKATINGYRKAKSDADSEDDEDEEDEVNGEADKHAALVAEIADYAQTHKVAEVAEFVVAKEANLELFSALVEALFRGISKGFAREATRKKAVFAAAAKDATTQKLLLQGLEQFFALKAAEAGKEIALVLKTMYDDDLLEEEVIIDWADGPAVCPGLTEKEVKAVRKFAEPFLSWLKEAESEDDE